jgi:hypothetical protein
VAEWVPWDEAPAMVFDDVEQVLDFDESAASVRMAEIPHVLDDSEAW